MLDATPEAYAKNLARYISDPSTIRARTVDFYGRAPSLAECAKLRRRVEEANRRAFELAERRSGSMVTKFPCQHERSDENTTERKGHQVCRLCTSRREALAAKRARIRRGQRLWPAHYVPPKQNLKGSEMLAEVARVFNLSVEMITGQSRSAYIVDARAVFSRIMVNRGLSRKAIGRMLGGRDHSTICNLIDTWERRCAANPELETVYGRLAA